MLDPKCRETKPMSRDLIIVRAGPGSLHRTWLEADPSRDWDLFISPYIDRGTNFTASAGVMIGDVLPGQKWTGLRALLNGWPDWRNYRYVALPDDDLFAMPRTWSRFFELAARCDAKLAAPALSVDSLFSYWVTVRNTEFVARRVSFVELMMPCFRSDVLSKLLPTLDLTETGYGWGLDIVWPKLLSYEDIFIVDETPVVHPRPGSYTDSEMVAKGRAEMDGALRKYDASLVQKTLAGIDASGVEIPETNPGFLYRLFRGYAPLFESQPQRFRQMFSDQLSALPEN